MIHMRRPVIALAIGALALFPNSRVQGACEPSVSASGIVLLTRTVPDPGPPLEAIRATIAIHATDDFTDDGFVGTLQYTSPSEGIRFHAERFVTVQWSQDGSFTAHFTGTVNGEPGAEGDISIFVGESTSAVAISIVDAHGNIFGGDQGILSRGTAKITTCL